MRQLEVRYVDSDRELVGWIRVPDTMMVLGTKLTVPDAQEEGETPKPVEFAVVSLPGGFGNNYLALRADGHTAERLAWLLRAYGFVSAGRR